MIFFILIVFLITSEAKNQFETGANDEITIQEPVRQEQIYYYYYPVQEERNENQMITSESKPYLALIIPLLLLAAMMFLLGWLSNWTYTPVFTEAFNVAPSQRSYSGPMSDFHREVDKLFILYSTAASSDECIERLLCDIGTRIPKDSRIDKFLWTTKKFIPNGINRKLSILEKSYFAESDKECDQYVCRLPVLKTRIGKINFKDRKKIGKQKNSSSNVTSFTSESQ